MKRLIVILLLLASPCLSQEMKQVKKRKVFDKQFWLATAAIVGTTILDAETTARCRRNNGCSEANPIYGRNPSRAKLYGIKGSFAGIAVVATWWWKRDDMKKLESLESYEFRKDSNSFERRQWDKPRSYWYLPALIVGGVTGGAGIHNLAARPKRPATPAQPISQPGTPNQP